MQRAHAVNRCGYTLAELAVVVGILGLSTVVGVRAVTHHLDRIAVRSAVAEAAGVVARARDLALARREVVALRIDTAGAALVVRTRDAAVARHALGHAYGVSLATTRDSIAFDARGLGRGAANFTLVARRGDVAETLVVSRLGRTR
jgi:Tfp pilus assembly protein FimT